MASRNGSSACELQTLISSEAFLVVVALSRLEFRGIRSFLDALAFSCCILVVVFVIVFLLL